MPGIVTTETPKTFEDLGKLADTASRSEIQIPGGDEELVFEGGSLDGKRMTVRELKEIDSDELDGQEGGGKVADAGKQPDPAAAATEVSPAPGEVAPAVTAAEATPADPAQAAEKLEYKPDFKLKVYDQEKEFPEWAKKVSTSKEVEDHLRASLQKSEAFDQLKPKHESVIRERDEARSMVHEQVRKVNAMAKARDTNPHLFMRSMGITDDQILRLGVQLAQAQTDPAVATSLAAKLAADEQALAQETAVSSQAEDALRIHRQTVDFVMASPVVSTFRQRMDAVYGEGSFDQAFSLTGSAAYGKEGYLHPQVVAERVMSQYGQLLPQPGVVPVAAAGSVAATPGVSSPTGTGAGPGGVVAPQAAPPQRVKAIPNVGVGSAVSPARTKMRSLDDVQKRVNAELGR